MQYRNVITGKVIFWCTILSSQFLPLQAKSQAPKVLSFEQAALKNIKSSSGSSLSISNNKAKDGMSSLKWIFSNKSELTIDQTIGYKPFNATNKSKARHSFMTWVYNGSAIDDTLQFEFSTQGEKRTYFDFNLNFTGWRAIVVPFADSMQGSPDTNMDQLTIKAPPTSGILYFDQMALSLPVDPRWPTPDYQIPFINKNITNRANAHWGALLEYDTWLKAFDQQPQPAVSDDERLALTTIIKRIDADLLQAAKPYKAKRIRSLLKNGEKLSTNENGELKPVQMWRQIEVYHQAHVNKAKLKLIKQSTVRFQKMGKHLLELAHAYRTSKSEKLKQKITEQFSTLVAHLLEQGYTRGSSAGIMHHQGYAMREWSEAIFLGRDMLGKHKQAAQQATSWLIGFGRIFRPDNQNVGFNVDVMNTFLPGMLMSVLLESDTNKQVAYLRVMQRWMSYSMLATKGLAGGIQPDGSFFHHSQHYIAYGNGGLRGLSPVVYFMGATPFALSKPAYQRLRHAVLMTRIISNGLKVPMSLAGRHPEEYAKITLAPFKYLSLMGDKKVAQAYLRLQDNNENIEVKLKDTKRLSSAQIKKLKRQILKKAKKKQQNKKSLLANTLTNKGLLAEDKPNGSWAMNYSSLAIHRQDEWLATARGFSRYLVGNESYKNANHFGRYMNYGHVEIIPSSNTDSGFSEAGWDWNRWSGTTTTHLPLDKLAAKIAQVDEYSGIEEMLLSQQTFSGANQLDGKYAMFAMKLQGHAKYESDLQARKSVFFFDDQVVALGSGISNNDKSHHTETTLFQQALLSPNISNYHQDKKFTGLELDKTMQLKQATYLVDTKNNAYFVAPNQTLRLLRQKQNSQENEKKQATQGDFTTALIDHGKAPKNDSYQYSILINSSNERAEKYYEQLHSDAPPYQILQQTNDAHIVKYTEMGVTGYTLFEAHNDSNHLTSGVVKGNSTPIMVMSQQQGEQLLLSVTDPDLNFYQGTETDQLTQNGLQKEVSIYSRKWRKNEPQPKISQLTLNGLWQGAGKDFRILKHSNDQTIIEITSVASKPIQINLSPVSLVKVK